MRQSWTERWPLIALVIIVLLSIVLLQRHAISLALWCACLGLFGTAIFQLLRARRTATNVLAASEERFRAQYKGIPIPTYTWQKVGDDFILQSYNDAAEQITAGAVAKLVGAHASKLYHDRPDFLADFARCATEHVTIQRELEYYFQTNQESKVLFTSYVFIPPDLVMVHTEDLTERKQLEAQLLRAQKMEGIGRLAGGIAHDFNNLLTAILGYADLALDSLPPNQPARADLVEIQRAAERAAKLTAQLLAFARKQPLQPSNLQLNELISNIEGLIRRVLPEHVLVSTRPAAQLGTVRADAGQLEQVLLNLVLNARDAMPDGGQIIIETSNAELDDAYARQYTEVTPGSYVLLSVSDTGVGMPPDVQQRAFEPFFTTKGPSHGSGLGLAMCYGIVKQHNGHITIYSEVGQGTTINVYLPLIDSLATAHAEESSPRVAHGTETVLVAEDQDQVRAVVALMLRQLGYTVLEASSGAEALRMAEQRGLGTIQLVITDVVMPHMSGRELSEKLIA